VNLAFTPHVSALVAMVESVMEKGVANPTIIIDGPSGAGKSTVADYLAQHIGHVQLLRLDDVYPGWNGLEAAAMVAEHILAERHLGRAASWQRYDWGRGERTTWHDVSPHQLLIIEGCGSLSQIAQDTAEIRVWVSVAEEIRKDRALSRGGEDFESHWDEWDQHFELRIRRENPARFANIILAAN